MLTKIAESDVNAALMKAASLLRSQQARIHELESNLGHRDRLDHAVKIASAAAERGIVDNEEVDEYARTLVDGNRDLDMVEEFVNRSVRGNPLATTTLEKEASYAGDGEVDVLTNFLLTSDL
jgi:hypothetical protein